MSVRTFKPEEKLALIEEQIERARDFVRGAPPDSGAHRQFEILKAIAADLRARADLPRSNALGELERAIDRAVRSKTDLGYDRGKLIAIAETLIGKWAFISQALERFGEETAE